MTNQSILLQLIKTLLIMLQHYIPTLDIEKFQLLMKNLIITK